MKYYVYGIAGVEDQYRIVRYENINTDYEPFTISIVKKIARDMRCNYPWIKYVYVVDASPQLAIDFKSTINAKRMDANVDFRLMLERNGLLLPSHC